MNENVVITVLAAVILFLICGLAGVIIYFTRREKKFAGSMEDMLEDAVSGRFQEKHLDESRMSVIENNMWRYLCDHERKISRMTKEREQMQEQISDISHQAVIPISNIMLYSAAGRVDGDAESGGQTKYQGCTDGHRRTGGDAGFFD